MRLIVGGSRGERGTIVKPYDITMDIDKDTDPHVFGNIDAAPFKDESFDCVLFECFPFSLLLSEELGYIKHAYRLVKNRGKLVVITGCPPVIPMISAIEEAGFFVEKMLYKSGCQIEAVKIWWLDVEPSTYSITTPHLMRKYT